MIQCSNNAIIPHWAYLLISSKLIELGIKNFIGTKNEFYNYQIMEKIKDLNEKDFIDKPLIIKGCSDISNNNYFYSIIIEKLQPFVKSIMFGMGKAMMGTGEASGEKRAIEAAEAAISNPLLDDVSMKGAQGLLISITGGEDLTLFEVDEVATRIRDEVDNNANIILGATFDSNLEGSVKVSVVAAGIQSNIKNIDSTNYTFNKNYTIFHTVNLIKCLVPK